jgi:hypothetical protein
MLSNFTLEIELGNDAMQNAGDISDALRCIAEDLDNLGTNGRIRDLNGNTVGKWSLT